MKTQIKRMALGSRLSVAVCSMGLILVAGCAAPQPQWSQAAVNKQTQTGVQVKPSELGVALTPSVEYIRIKNTKSIFLDPPEGNTDVYLLVGDTSGREWAGIPIRDVIAQELRKRGYSPVTNAKDAAYALQVNCFISA